MAGKSRKSTELKGRVLITEKVDRIDGTIHEFTKEFLKKSIPGMLISFSKPYNTIKEHLEKSRIDVSKLFVVDSITETPQKRESNVLFTGGLSELTDISITINQFVDSVGGSKFLIMDALNILLIYNDLKSVSKFVASITSRIAARDVTAVFFVSSKEKELIDTIYPFFDRVQGGVKSG